MTYATALLNGVDNAATVLVAPGGLAAGAASLTVLSAAGFPAVPFALGLGVYSARYEEVIVTAVAGTTWTLLSATTKAHPDGEMVENTIAAEVLARLSDMARQHTHQGTTDGAVLTDATVPVTQAFGDAAAAGTAAALARRDHRHGMPANPAPAFGFPAIGLGSAAAAGSAGTVIRSDATIQAFDALAPPAVSYGGAGGTGTVNAAARRDHGHALAAILRGDLPVITQRWQALGTTGGPTTTATTAAPVALVDPVMVINTLGGDLLVHWHGVFSTNIAGTYVGLFLTVDGVTVGAGINLYCATLGRENMAAASVFAVGLAAGAHTVRLYWGASGGATATANGTIRAINAVEYLK